MGLNDLREPSHFVTKRINRRTKQQNAGQGEMKRGEKKKWKATRAARGTSKSDGREETKLWQGDSEEKVRRIVMLLQSLVAAALGDDRREGISSFSGRAQRLRQISLSLSFPSHFLPLSPYPIFFTPPPAHRDARGGSSPRQSRTFFVSRFSYTNECTSLAIPCYRLMLMLNQRRSTFIFHARIPTYLRGA